MVALAVVLPYTMRLPPITSGQPDSFTVGNAILVVGYLLFPVLALLAAALLLVTLLLLVAHLIESRRTPADREVEASPQGGYQGIIRSVGWQRPGREWVAPSLTILLGAASLCIFYLGVTTLRAGDTMHIDVTPLSTVFALCAGLAVTAGVVVVLFLREAAVGVRFSIAVGLLVFAVLAMFSIGLVILPVALLVLGLAIRQLVRRRSGHAARAALAGAVIGIGAVAYLLVLIQPAAAECRPSGGGATSSGGLFGPTALSQGGYIDEGDRIGYFTCRDGKLIDFHRETLPLGNWVVTTQPSATVGRTVMVVFRVRPAAGKAVPADGFDFSATCRTCAEPRPVVGGHADRLGTRAPGTPASSATFAGQVVFPTAGSWYTSPHDGAIEVR